MGNNMAGIIQLPHDIKAILYSLLDEVDINNLRSSCKLFANSINKMDYEKTYLFDRHKLRLEIVAMLKPLIVKCNGYESIYNSIPLTEKDYDVLETVFWLESFYKLLRMQKSYNNEMMRSASIEMSKWVHVMLAFLQSAKWRPDYLIHGEFLLEPDGKTKTKTNHNFYRLMVLRNCNNVMRSAVSFCKDF